MGVTPQFWAGRKVLVTGNTGFKGSWMTLWLLELGAEVVGLADGVPTDPAMYELCSLGNDVPQEVVDVRDAAAVAAAVAKHRPEIVFHLAAQPMVRRSFSEPVETYATNVMGTVHLLDAIRRHGSDTRVVVNVTSDKCYENREWEWGYREDEPMGGHDPYSNSKGCSELVTSAFRVSFFGDGKGPVLGSGRAGNVIGGGDWGEDRIVPDAIRAMSSGSPLAIRRPDAIRPWQHVLNPVLGYLLLAERLEQDTSLAGGYNFGPPDEDALPVGDLIEMLASRLPGGLPVESDPGPHPHEATWLKLDSSRARARLGWSPRWGLDRAVDEIVDWHVRVAAGEDARAVSLEHLARFDGGRA